MIDKQNKNRDKIFCKIRVENVNSTYENKKPVQKDDILEGGGCANASIDLFGYFLFGINNNFTIDTTTIKDKDFINNNINNINNINNKIFKNDQFKL